VAACTRVDEMGLGVEEKSGERVQARRLGA
jgi:hypothetical protein